MDMLNNNYYSRDMRKIFFTLLTACAITCAPPNDEKHRTVYCGASDEAPSVSEIVPVKLEIQPAVKPGSTIMLMGDSLGHGMSQRFRGLAISSGYKPATEVISGTSTFQWVFWINRHLKAHKPALVLVSLGTNDAMQLERAKKQDVYAEISKVIEDSGAKLVWILPHRISKSRIPKIDDAREFIRSSVPLSFDSTKINIPLAPDKVHTSTKGYELWIEEVWKWMEETNLIAAVHK
jgi:hypothetical protein